MGNSRPVSQGPFKNFFTDTVDIIPFWALTVLLMCSSNYRRF